MAETSLRSRRRRTKNEINMVPFIDVMLVLLIIFMVSAPLMPTGVVDLPSIGKARQAPDKVIEVVLGKDDALTMSIDKAAPVAIDLASLAERVKDEQERAAGGPDNAPVIISARKDVRYDAVVQVMDRLQRGGVKRVGLAVRTTGG
ncbi:protein TolR [Aquabacterium soli]|uniref:Protein TolR n=1 Tax=Aquabacterium soli TaxID=2493092 RepID=A0A426VE76_9BURK|nr:biopolymer transporter ExbD [Aquabacterium soli]RRS05172.1 protein TolR [Aquabacterium soli]